MSNSILYRANFGHTKLIGANLSYANLSVAWMSGADLTDADLQRTNLGGTVFSSVIAKNTKFDGADLRYNDYVKDLCLAGADINGAITIGSCD